MNDLVPSLSPRDYVDGGVHAREVSQVFAANWLPVGRVDQLDQPGRHVAVTLAGVPIVAVREADTIRVLANVCAHRGSQLVEDGTGSSSTLVCPYHRWAYRLDGTLIGAPLSDGAPWAAMTVDSLASQVTDLGHRPTGEHT